MSQQELAARAGLRREKVNRLESKGEDIGLDELCRLLDAVGLELSVSDKGAAKPSVRGAVRHGEHSSVRASQLSHSLVPGDFEKASFIDGAKAKIIDWGKVPR